MTLAALGLLALAWVLTYLVHSTLLLGGTWLAVRRGRLGAAGEDRLWKLALVGGLVTASLQVGAGLEPFGGRVHLAGDTPPALDEPVAGTTSPLARAESRFPVDGGGTPPQGAPEEARFLARTHGPGESPEPHSGSHSPTPIPRSVTVPAAEPRPSLWASLAPRLRAGAELSRPWLAGLWLLGAAVGASAFLVALRRLRRHLRDRAVLDHGPLRERLDRLMRRAKVRGSVRLTASPHLAAPVTLGFFKREICVPVRALTDLTGPQQEAMLGHELGHAIRRDPAWLGLCWMLETVLCFQPLNRLGRRRLQHTAELLCDDWAVHLTGRTLSLASCLTEVAQWVVGRDRALPVPGMAGAPLTQRVERLLADEPRPLGRRGRAWLPSALAALGLIALGAPGFSAAAAPTEVPPPPTPPPAPDGADRVDAPEPTADPFDEAFATLGAMEAQVRGLKREIRRSGRPELEDQAQVIDERLRRVRDQLTHLRRLYYEILAHVRPDTYVRPHTSDSRNDLR